MRRIIYISCICFLLQLLSCTQKVEPAQISSSSINQLYGFDADNHEFKSIKVEPNQFLSQILTDQGIPYIDIHNLEIASKDIFSVRKIKAGKELTFVHLDTCSSPSCMIYEPDAFRYVRYHLDDEACIEVVEKDVEIKIDMFEGEVETSLWDALIGQGHSPSIIDKMEDAFASSVDFYHVQRCDAFKFIYEKQYVEGKFVGYGDLLAGYFINDSGKHYSIFFENEKYEGFYDVEGRPTKGAFLRSPLRYSRISSRFNRRRFHPIKKRVIPHLGTDYAAPTGTPIRSVADGVVSIVSRTKNNGKYVKIKHGKTYQTQYLHMSGFASGIKSGTRVKQGQTIGYVGQTGLATGPHVCFRFWKNGKQTNHLRENFPPAEPMAKSELPLFFSQRDHLIDVLEENISLDELDLNQEEKPTI